MSTISLGHQLKVLITGVLMIAVVAGGWVLGVQPPLDAAFAASDAQDDVRAQNDAIRAELTALESAQEELPSLEDDLAVLNASIPLTDDSSALIDGIHELADDAGVLVDGVTLENAEPYLPPQPVQAASAPAGTPADPAAADGGGNPLLPATDPRITPANFVLVPVTVAVTGSFDDVLDFVDGVQSGERLFLVNRLSSAADAQGNGSTVTANVGGYVYVLLSGEPGAES